MADWRNSLLPASFRGVEFFVDSSTDEIGRTTVIHSFPQRKNPYVEDLGECVRKISLQALILGKDYFNKRQDLEEVLNEPGPGTLVHPYFGSILVCLSSPCQLQHSKDNGGLCSFTLEFVRVDSENSSQIKASTNLSYAIKKDSQSIRENIQQGLAYALHLEKASSYVKEQTLSFASKMLSVFEPAEDLKNILKGSLDNNQEFAKNFVDTFESSSEKVVNPQELLTVSPVIPIVEIPLLAGSSAIGIKKNERALLLAVNTLILTFALSKLATFMPSTRADIYAIRAEFVFRFDILNHDIEDNLFTQLLDLRVKVFRLLAENLGKVPRLLRVQHEKSQSSLDLSYYYFADINAEKNISTRNQVEHPGFLPAGKILEVYCE